MSKKIRKKDFLKKKEAFYAIEISLALYEEKYDSNMMKYHHVSEETSQLFKYPSSRQMIGG